MEKNGKENHCAVLALKGIWDFHLLHLTKIVQYVYNFISQMEQVTPWRWFPEDIMILKSRFTKAIYNKIYRYNKIHCPLIINQNFS